MTNSSKPSVPAQVVARMPKVYPRRGHVYSLRSILQHLELRDSPHLCFTWAEPYGDGVCKTDGSTVGCVIQIGHVTDAELLSVPGMADSQWAFVEETHEWIPVFRFAAENTIALSTLVDMEVCKSRFDFEPGWSVTPKGFPREQFTGDEEYPAPAWQLTKAPTK